MSDPVLQSMLDELSAWLGDRSVLRALVLETAQSDAGSPLGAWRERVNARAGSGNDVLNVVWLAVEPTSGLTFERQLLRQLGQGAARAEVRDDGDDPSDDADPETLTQGAYRSYIAGLLSTARAPDARFRPLLVVIERLNWVEQSFHAELDALFGKLAPGVKVLVSVRNDDGRAPAPQTWLRRLGWLAESVLQLELSADVPTARRVSTSEPISIAVRNALAVARRPLDPIELVALCALDVESVHSALNDAPQLGLVVHAGRYGFATGSAWRAWHFAHEAECRDIEERLLRLGAALIEAVARGETYSLVPYVIESYGSHLFGRGELEVEIELLSPGWARVRSALDEKPGPFESDVARVGRSAREALRAGFSVEAIGACVRAEHLSVAALQHPTLLLEARGGPQRVNAAQSRARLLATLADALPAPARDSVREAAVATLYRSESPPDSGELLVRMAHWFVGTRRTTFATAAATEFRESQLQIRLLLVAGLVTGTECDALCDEAARAFMAREDEVAVEVDLGDLRRIAVELPIAVLERFAMAIDEAEPSKRRRAFCELAVRLDAAGRERLTHVGFELLSDRLGNPETSDRGFDLEQSVVALVPALDDERCAQLLASANAAKLAPYALGAAARRLVELGREELASSILGHDFGGMPFELAVGFIAATQPVPPELVAALERKIVALGPNARGWALQKHARELLHALGVDRVLEAARATIEEERIVGRLALVPFVPDDLRCLLVGEAVSAAFNPECYEAHELAELAACHKWMSVQDATRLCARWLQHDSDSIDFTLDRIESLVPLLAWFGGPQLVERIAQEVVEVATLCP